MNYDNLISFVIATLLLAISPGPDNIYVLVQSVTNGKKFGIAAVIGLTFGCLVHTTLVAFGVSAVIKQNYTLFFTIKFFGALYLMYLAYKVAKNKTEINFMKTVPKKTMFKLIKQGFVMNVLNPKVTLFFLAFFPSFLFSDTLSTLSQFYILGSLFMLTSFSVFATIAIVSGRIFKHLTGNTTAGLVLKYLQIIVFVGIAIFILI